MNAPERRIRQLCLTLQSQADIDAVACMLKESMRVGARPLIRGLSEESFVAMMTTVFGRCDVVNGAAPCEPFDEFEDLRDLLLEHEQARDQLGVWLACAIASAAQRDNHLWQDMGLPARGALSALLNRRFPTLAARNTQDMKWKKFFYRQLCLKAEVLICKSPHCAQCCDYALCFGPENA